MIIYILGCGAIGSNIAMNLAFDRRDENLMLIDFDKVEPRNYQFGTQQYFREQVGARKVEALTMNIYRATGGVKNIKFMEMKLWEKGGDSCYPAFSKDDLVIDCFDNYESRELIRRLSQQKSFDCFHVGFSPSMTFEICWNEDYKTPDDTHSEFDICEAQGARSFIQYVSGLATNVINTYLEKGDKLSMVGRKFGITKIE